MARPKKDPGIRKKEFTDAAEKLFFKKGYDATSVQDILKAVGGESLSPSVFYYYFSSKEDLFEATINAYISGYLEGISEALMNKALTLPEKVQKIKEKIETALDNFTHIQSYFINDKGYSRRLYQVIAQNVFTILIDPTQMLIEDCIQDDRLPKNGLQKIMSSRRMAYLLLYASYSLFHKENERDYLENIKEALKMLPFILEQILSLPMGSLS